MKRTYNYLLIMVMITFLVSSVHGQNIFYQENVGTPTANTPIQNYNGWQNTQAVYTGDSTCDVRTSNASSGYEAASGNGNVMINNETKWFQISHLNTSEYEDVKLHFGLRKSTTAEDGSSLVIRISEDGENWQTLPSYQELPTGSGTTGWYYIIIDNIPSVENLHIKFSNLGTVDFRIDDLALSTSSAVATPEVVANPQFSPPAGTYSEAQTVTISSATQESTLYYTLDGSTPHAGSLCYSAPIAVDANVTIKAIALKEGMTESEIATAAYIIEENDDDDSLGTARYLQEVKLYPNPVLSMLYVESKEIIEKVEVFTLQGRLVKSIAVGEKSIQLATDDLKSGIYMIRVQSFQSTFTRKIIKP